MNKLKALFLTSCLVFTLSNVANAGVIGTCTVDKEVNLLGTIIVNATFQERYGSRRDFNACSVARSRCYNNLEKKMVPEMYKCSKPIKRRRNCKVKLIRVAFGQDIQVVRVFTQKKANFRGGSLGPNAQGIYDSRRAACKAAKENCQATNGLGRCVIIN